MMYRVLEKQLENRIWILADMGITDSILGIIDIGVCTPVYNRIKRNIKIAIDNYIQREELK